MDMSMTPYSPFNQGRKKGKLTHMVSIWLTIIWIGGIGKQGGK